MSGTGRISSARSAGRCRPTGRRPSPRIALPRTVTPAWRRTRAGGRKVPTPPRSAASAAAVPVTSCQTWTRCPISWRYAPAGSKGRRGRRPQQAAAACRSSTQQGLARLSAVWTGGAGCVRLRTQEFPGARASGRPVRKSWGGWGALLRSSPWAQRCSLLCR